MNHSKLTIVAVYGHNSGESAIPAIVKSMNELPGSRGLLISLEKPDNLPNEITWKHVHHLNYKRYSFFMMHMLYAYIETDYCLIVQDDGWVLNGKNFKPEYYDYDYIGPPSHCAIKINENSEVQSIYLNFNWTIPEVINTEHLQVIQNGGFSLRSKRFLEACNKEGLCHYAIESIPLNDKESGDKKNWAAIWNEDVHLSGLFKSRLEKAGYKYAPLEVAINFGIEYLNPNLHPDTNSALVSILGMHGSSRKLVTLDSVEILTASVNTGLEHNVVNFLIESGYKVKWVKKS